ncbi:MAG: sigma-70 family RNA polymerase sigma factor [Lachnospiraceae bacterium]|nr:sigma-70 family RNA polymerase sigma factor [Lachnospiraceae bacterium]
MIERKPREVSFTEQYGENAQSVMDAIPDSSVDVENEVVERMEHQEVHKIISKLEPEEKLIIYSVFFEGKTQDEVGRIMGISQLAVHQRLEKILEKMHQMLL